VERIGRLYYVEAGKPSYPALAREAEKVLSEAGGDQDLLRHLPRATACDLVKGKYKKVPDWLLVRTFVVVCHCIAVRSNLPIAPRDHLVNEFAQLWQAAKGAERAASPMAHCREEKPEDASSDGVIAGDVLAPLAGEIPARRTAPMRFPLPGGWGRRGDLRLKHAEAGDAQAAYELAVLLACEAAGMGGGDTGREEARRWREMAAYWRGRAMGKVPEAAELRLEGLQLVRAARALAIKYKKAGRAGSMDLFMAVTQAEGSVQGLLPRSMPGAGAGELVDTDDRDE
jgi:hypothetical protein